MDRLLASHTGNGTLDVFDLGTGALVQKVPVGAACSFPSITSVGEPSRCKVKWSWLKPAPVASGSSRPRRISPGIKSAERMEAFFAAVQRVKEVQS